MTGGVLKIFEKRKERLPPLQAIVEADQAMRTKLAEKQMQDKLSRTDAVKTCRAQCADNFIDLNGMAPAEGIARNNGKQRSERPAKHPRTELARV